MHLRVNENQSKHIVYEIYHKEERIATTYCSYGSEGKDIDDNILGEIKRQLLLDKKKQLDDLKNCPMSAEDYFDLLKQKNVVSD